MQALSIALGRGTVDAPTLYRLPGLSPVIRSLYAVADLAPVAELPWDKATLDVAFCVPGRVLDLRDYAFDPAFRGVAMIDFFLGRLGTDPLGVPAAARRNTWLAPRLDIAAWRPDGPVLLCAKSSMALRDMPDPVADAIFAFFTTRGIAVARPTEAKDIAGLAAQIRAARLVVSTDTAMVHLADAMAVPCVAFFPTHDPAWRVRDYPLCTAIRLDPGLPAALEFSRGDADLAATRAAWFRPGLDWLEPVLEAALG